ncbi:hypothetical protein EFA69_15505 [Rufibacter immobilis]|uniref:Toxin-antitoxin system YwqK family antitoxin n=1 Tax=Rufibacter immobilis TaxID=1348778 RepID=A0A3M9MPW0_9BACT|nr:hypothetical protein [Rufibacter immobilis]RNI27531.1 hypothetical protein EFA69_15505 [Rufibacter immobilis]
MEKSAPFFESRKAVFALLLASGLVLQSLPSAAAWPWQWNQYDKKQLKNGRWRVYHDADSQVLHYSGRYRHGKEVGRWKTYTADGNLYFKERIKRRKNYIETVYYHPNGQVSHRGLAYLRDAEHGGVHYYWDGDWEYFDEAGKALGIKTFAKGTAVTNTPVLSNNKKKKE